MDVYPLFQILHAVGFILGLGSLFFLDAFFLKERHLRISRMSLKIIGTGHRLVVLGLIILWLSGFGFLWHYLVTDMLMLGNPKIYAKVSVVTLLTLNGFLMGWFVLPLLESNLGRRIGEIEPKLIRRMGTVLALSGVCWFYAFLLGMAKFLNFSFSIPELLTVFTALAALAVLSAQVFSVALFRRRPKGPLTTRNRRRAEAFGRAGRRLGVVL